MQANISNESPNTYYASIRITCLFDKVSYALKCRCSSTDAEKCTCEQSAILPEFTNAGVKTYST